MLVNSIFFFSYNVFYSILLRITILATADLSSANALNLVMSKNLSLGKELKKNYPNSTLQISHVSIRIDHNCVCWLVSCIEVLRHFNSKGHIMAVGDTRVPWLSHTGTNTNFSPKSPTTFLTCFSTGER